MATVSDILSFVEQLAPSYMKEEWDNVGLLCGSRGAAVKKILVALDPFMDVCREAKAIGADLIVTHHPLIFSPVKQITDDDPVGRCILFLARNEIAAINAHTNLDQAPGGVNDVLANRLGLTECRVASPRGLTGEGMPWGLIRIGEVAETDVREFAARVKERLGCPGVRFAEGGKAVHRVAVGGGACGGALYEAAAAGCDTLVTADVKYNQFCDAAEYGVNLIDAGHFETENPVCRVLADALREKFPDTEVYISEIHADPIQFL